MRGPFLILLFISIAYCTPWCSSDGCGIGQGCRLAVVVTGVTNETLRITNHPLNLSDFGCGAVNLTSLRAFFVNGSGPLPVGVGGNDEAGNTSLFFAAEYGAGDYFVYFGNGSFAAPNRTLSGFLMADMAVLTCTPTNPAVDPMSYLECPQPQSLGPISSDFKAHIELWSDAAALTTCANGGWPINGGVSTGDRCELQCNAEAGPMHKICEKDCHGSFADGNGYATAGVSANAQGSCQARVSASLFWYVHNDTVEDYSVEYAPDIDVVVQKYQQAGLPVRITIRNAGDAETDGILLNTSHGGESAINRLDANQSATVLVNMSPPGIYVVNITVSYSNYTKTGTYAIVLYNSTVRLLLEQYAAGDGVIYKTASLKNELVLFNNLNETYNLTAVDVLGDDVINVSCHDADGNPLNVTETGFDGGEIAPNATRRFACLYSVLSSETALQPASPVPGGGSGGGGGGGGPFLPSKNTAPKTSEATDELALTILSPRGRVNTSAVYLRINASGRLASCTAEVDGVAGPLYVQNSVAEKTLLGISEGTHALSVACFSDSGNATAERSFAVELPEPDVVVKAAPQQAGPAGGQEITGAYLDFSAVLPAAVVAAGIAAYLLYRRRISPSREARASGQRRTEN